MISHPAESGGIIRCNSADPAYSAKDLLDIMYPLTNNSTTTPQDDNSTSDDESIYYRYPSIMEVPPVEESPPETAFQVPFDPFAGLNLRLEQSFRDEVISKPSPLQQVNIYDDHYLDNRKHPQDNEDEEASVTSDESFDDGRTPIPPPKLYPHQHRIKVDIPPPPPPPIYSDPLAGLLGLTSSPTTLPSPPPPPVPYPLDLDHDGYVSDHRHGPLPSPTMPPPPAPLSNEGICNLFYEAEQQVKSKPLCKNFESFFDEPRGGSSKNVPPHEQTWVDNDGFDTGATARLLSALPPPFPPPFTAEPFPAGRGDDQVASPYADLLPPYMPYATPYYFRESDKDSKPHSNAPSVPIPTSEKELEASLVIPHEARARRCRVGGVKLWTRRILYTAAILCLLTVGVVGTLLLSGLFKKF
ncbi:hypothetical protein K431DRAFT_314432 [Polychaeton citri CBS 116435]|uniref:Uncharacterized protein n=1 Tax=Polychaeton citri CBS 116435 TaxID=1314669 RepID=A0A9P4Q3Y2_9PEZI|nr:hypothetical protein K431DRAFT_314432 [Polychaeton citri CBS 116435]